MQYICDGHTVDEKTAERFTETFEIAWLTRTHDDIIHIKSFWNCIKGDRTGKQKITFQDFLKEVLD